MDQNRYADPEDLISCPYEEVHQVTRKRMATHLDKCRKQHLELSKMMQPCPFNYAHQIPEREMEIHIPICPDRDSFYSQQYQVGNTGSKAVEQLVKDIDNIKVNIPSAESWDQEIEVQGVNVLEVIERNVEKRGLLKNHQHMPPSERKAKREEDRQKGLARMNAADDKGSDTLPQSSSAWPDLPKHTGSKTAFSSACSVMSDSSYTTAIDTAKNRMEDFQLVSNKKGRGRAAKLKMTSTPSAGLGRGRLMFREEN